MRRCGGAAVRQCGDAAVQRCRGAALHVEVVVRIFVASERVASAAVLADEGLVRTLLWVLVGAEEEHVLAEVGEAQQRRRVGRVAHAHIHGGSGLICLWVRDEQGRQLAKWAKT